MRPRRLQEAKAAHTDLRTAIPIPEQAWAADQAIPRPSSLDGDGVFAKAFIASETVRNRSPLPQASESGKQRSETEMTYSPGIRTHPLTAKKTDIMCSRFGCLGFAGFLGALIADGR